ncbi:MAG: hypothetical protein VX346_23855 [Planctomycetota bacterium]|nr:hypothetical protein [Planctomycetota bacterium]
MEFVGLIILIFVLLFLGCALYGFAALVGKLFGLGQRSTAARPPANQPYSTNATYVSALAVPENAAELHATCRQLVRMLRRGDLDQATYDQLRDKIDWVYHTLQVAPPPRLRHQSTAADTADNTADNNVPIKATLVQATSATTDPATSDRTTKTPSIRPPSSPKPRAAQPARPTGDVRPHDFRPSPPAASTPDSRITGGRPKSPFDFEDRPQTPKRDPRRPLAELLSGFMLENNIRWGELVGGMLIVGCAVGLVISLQTQLQALQKQFAYLVPLLFMIVTAAIHGAGTYTLRKWNLRSTSRGVLTIGLLLIPLNFLAATTLAAKEGAGIGLASAAVAIGTVGFSVMVYFSCRALFGRQWWLPSLALLLTSLSMVPINRLIPDNTPFVSALAMVLVGIPLAGFLTGNGLLTRHMLRHPANLAKDAEQLLLTLGVSLFGLALAVGLWLSKFATWSDPLDRLSLPGSLAAIVFLAIGLLLHHRAGRLEGERTWRITGTALAIFGGSLGTAAIVLAWPRAEMLIAVALVNTLVLSSASLRAGLPPHQIGAAINLGILATVFSHWIGGGLDQGTVSLNVNLLFSSTTSLALSGAMLLVGICSVVVPRLTRQRVDDQRKVLWGCCAALSFLSLSVALVAGWRSFQTGITTDLHIASGILFTYSVVGMGVGAISAHRLLLRIGAGLFWLALVHAMLFNLPLRETLFTWIDDHWTAWLAALLGHGIICSLIACLAWTLNRHSVDEDRHRAWRAVAAQELSWASLLSIGLAVPLAIWQHYTLYGLLAGELFIAAAVWLVGTLVHRTRYEFAVFQGLCFVAVNFLVARLSATAASELAWHQPEFWNYQLLAVGISCSGWNLLRLWCPTNSQLRSLLDDKQAPCDLIVLTGLAITLLLVAGAVAFPGVVNEFTPTHPEARVQLPLIGASTTWASYQSWSEDLAVVLWLSLAVTSLATLIWLATGHQEQALRQLLLLGLAASVLVVIPVFSGQHALASALRWSISSYGLLVALLVWRRRQLELVWTQVQRALKPAVTHSNLPSLSGSFPWIALGLTILPLLMLLTIVAARAIQKLPLGGPLPVSLFHKDAMLLEINYGVPLAFMVTTLLSYAIARRQSYYAFCGSIITMYLVGTGFVLFAISNDSALMLRLIAIIQIAAIFATVYGMLWLGLHGKIAGNTGQLPQQDRQLFFHVMIPGAMALFLALGGLFFVTCYPQSAGGGTTSAAQSITKALGSPLGYVTLAGVVGLYLWYFWTRLQAYTVWLTACGAVAVLATTAAGIHGSSATPWLAFRFMMMGILTIAAMVTILPWIFSTYRGGSVADNQSRWESAVCSALFAGWAFCLACYSLTSHPAWSMAVLVGLLLLTSLLAFRYSPMLAYVGQVWILAGILFIWIGWGPAVRSASAFMQLLHGGALATILYATFWMILEILGQSGPRLVRTARGPLYHRITAIGLLGLFVPAFGLEFFVQLFVGQTALNGPLLENPTGWLTALAGGGLLLGLLWDRESKVRLFPLFLWGLLMSGLPVLALGDKERLWPACGLAMGVYLAICGWFWRNQYRWAQRGRAVGIADAEALLSSASKWFIPTQSALTILITLAQLIPVWGFADRTDRFLAAMVPFCGCLGLVATATAARGRNWLPELALLLFSVFGVFAGWADLGEGMAGDLWLQRLVRLLMVTAFLTLLYGFLLPRWSVFPERWRTALEKMTLGVTAVALVSLIGVLALERLVPNSLNAIEAAAVAAILMVLVATLIAAALIPTHDPLQLTAKGRQIYIYGAQAIAGLLVLHLYSAFPEIFQTSLFHYWPYLLMGIAFTGCGLSEVFHRRQLTVLADPLGNTGFVISVVPAALIWFDLEHQAEPAVILLTIGVLHLVTGAIRGSLVLGLSSIVFGNLALWTFYGHYEYFQFTRHPQLWLIPPAISVLAAIQLNRSLLTPAQISFTRLACVAVIYVSSTSEVFLGGIGDELMPPMVLAVLSVMGVLLGIAMRIRIFLYLGSSFLFVSILTMLRVAHRQMGGDWVWWVFGICLGLAIVTLFALFDKKRTEMTAWITRVRNWED